MILENHRALEMTPDEALALAAELIKAVRHAGSYIDGSAWFSKPVIVDAASVKKASSMIFRVVQPEVAA